MAKNNLSFFKRLAAGLFVAVSISFAGMLAIAALIVYAGIDEKTIMLLNQLLKILSVIAGVSAAVPKGSENGFLLGAALACAYTAAGYLLYIVLGNGSFKLSALLGELLLSVAAGAVTGAVRANLTRNKRRKTKRAAVCS